MMMMMMIPKCFCRGSLKFIGSRAPASGGFRCPFGIWQMAPMLERSHALCHSSAKNKMSVPGWYRTEVMLEDR